MGLKVYLDSCIVIYLIEEHQTFAPQIESYLAQFSDVQIYFSHLIELECLVLPLRNKNQVLIEKFQNWFQTINVLSLNQKVFQNAAQLRADFPSLKTPDALHLSTALYHNCDEFWTNDNRLDKVAPQLVKNIL